LCSNIRNAKVEKTSPRWIIFIEFALERVTPTLPSHPPRSQEWRGMLNVNKTIQNRWLLRKVRFWLSLKPAGLKYLLSIYTGKQITSG
jgi:hypothetical protein